MKRTGLTLQQILCLQKVCLNETFEQVIEDYAENLEQLGNVSIIKCTNTEASINLYKEFEAIEDIRKQLYTPFSGGKVNVLNSNILFRLLATGDGVAITERCIAFDTQTVSYLERYCRGKAETLSSNNINIENVVRLMRLKNIGVDYIPYATENLLFNTDRRKPVFDSLYSFEKMFYEGRKSNFACRMRVERVLWLYRKNNGRKYNEFKRLYYLLYAVMLEIARIQLCYPRKSAEYKIKQLVVFMDQKLNTLMYPELILANRYYRQLDEKQFFDKIYKGRNNILDTIKNMTWDLFHLRMLEVACMVPSVPKADIFIPYMFTYDKRLFRVKDCYELDALAICTESIERFPFYAHISEVRSFLRDVTSVEREEARRFRQTSMDLARLVSECETAVKNVGQA